MIAENPKSSARSPVGPVLLITIGLVWVLYNARLIDGGSLALLIRLWPLLLIVIGLDLLIGQRATRLRGVFAVGAAAAVLAFLLVAPRWGLVPTLDLRTSHYNAPVADTTAATVNLSFSLGEAIVEPVVDRGQLIDANLTHVGEIEFTATGDRSKTVTLQERDRVVQGWTDWLAGRGRDQQPRWQVGLSPEVPIDLNIDGGLGDVALNLQDLNLTGLRLNGGAGTVVLDLPAAEQHYRATVNGGVGSTSVAIPDRADLALDMDGGAGGATISVGEGARVTLNIDAGVGAFTIDVPEDAAVRIRAEGGLGGVDLPSRFQRVDGNARDGTWETTGFERAETTIVIDYTGGVGGLTVR